MTTIGGAGPQSGRAAWAGEAVAVGCVTAALGLMGVLHVSGGPALDPMVTTISDYVYLPGGNTLLAATAFAVATAAVVLAGGLRRAGLPRPGPPAALLLSAAAALVLVVAFPTNEPGTSAGVVASVHRLAGGWFLAAVPLAGWLVARQARTAPNWTAAAPALRGSAGTAGVLSIGFLLSHVPIVITGLPLVAMIGGFQRVLCASVMVVVVTTARATRMAMDGARSTTVVVVGHELRSAT